MPAGGAIVDFGTGSCVAPLFNGLATCVYSACVGRFQGHHANIWCSQVLIVCVHIFVFAPSILVIIRYSVGVVFYRPTLTPKNCALSGPSLRFLTPLENDD